MRYLLLFLLLGAQSESALDTSVTPATLAPKGADLQLLGAVREIAGEVERLRGQPFDRPPIAVRTPDDIRVVAAEIRAQNVLPRERLRARGRAWEDVGLGDAATPSRLYALLATDLRGVGFDPGGNRLLVSPQRLTVEDFHFSSDDDADSTVLMMTGVRPDEPLVGHLLMHVRQRERSGGDSLNPQTDRMLARALWAEGEANLLALLYLFEGMGLANEVIASTPSPGDFLDGSLLPAGLDALDGVEASLARFVYIDGFAAAARAYGEGGWAAVDRAIARGRTTRDIIHPDRAGAPAPPIAVPDVESLQGLRLVDEDTLGEEAIVVLISTSTGKDNLGLIGGDGWAGDRIYRWEIEAGDRRGEGITVWKTRWNSPQEAEDFDYAYLRSLKSRFPAQAPREAAEGTRVVDTGRRVYRVHRAGNEVVVRVATPGLDARLAEAETPPPS